MLIVVIALVVVGGGTTVLALLTKGKTSRTGALGRLQRLPQLVRAFFVDPEPALHHHLRSTYLHSP